MNEPLGLPSRTVLVVPSNPQWAELYAREADRLNTALGARGLDVALEHTGSTAVPGLAAKPIIDILAGWQDASRLVEIIQALQSLGYVHRGEQGIPGRDFFRRGDPRQYHLHLTARGSAFWQDHLLFPDLLRRDPATAAEYGALKTTLAQKYPRDREAYIEGKTLFVKDSLARARAMDL